MNLRPELLLHPTIPAPLHSIAPRTIKGKKWWDVVRKEAYALNDDCCHVCGTHKSKTWYRKYLEGHESYEIDYDTCTVELKEVVALCHSCHNFIHVGRLLKQYHDNVVSRNYVTNVLDWGVNILSKAGLQPNATQAIHWLILKKGYSKYDAIEYAIKAKLYRDKFNPHRWDEWELILDGKEYTGLSVDQWNEKYE